MIKQRDMMLGEYPEIRGAKADAITGRKCLRCGMISWHPTDVKEGYCGHCHDWTPGELITFGLPVS